MKPNLEHGWYYIRALSKVQRCRNPRAGKLIDYKTRIYLNQQDQVVIRHHNTDIIKIDQDDNFIINTGGWNSRTTNKRLNKHTPHEVYFFSSKGELLVSVDGRWYNYAPNMKISRTFTVTGAEKAKMPRKMMRQMLMPLLEQLCLVPDSKLG